MTVTFIVYRSITAMGKVYNLVCLFSLLCGSVYAHEPISPDTITGPRLVFVNNDTLYDFGGIPKGAFVEYQFEIMNTGNSPLIISGMACESANVKCKWPGKPLKPGKKSFITVTYTANGDEGSFKNDIYITSNATESPYPFLHVFGAVIPDGGSFIPSSTPSSKTSRWRHAH